MAVGLGWYGSLAGLKVLWIESLEDWVTQIWREMRLYEWEDCVVGGNIWE